MLSGVTKIRLSSILIVRVIMSLISHTWYVPDETWQSVEVSHKLVFGSGYLTWEWAEQIRSSLHPLLFSLPLYLLRLLGADYQLAVVVAPKLVQGLLTGLCEYLLCVSVERMEGSLVGAWFFILTVFNWHTLYTASRTLINTLEYSLTCAALAFFFNSFKLMKESGKKLGPSLYFLPLASVCLMVRPTSALLWAPLGLYRLSTLLRLREYRALLTWISVSLLAVFACVAVDSWFYGELTLTPLNFFMFNVYNNLGVHYGSHPWHWYASSALPSLLGPLLLPLLQGVRLASLYLLLPIAVNLSFLSILPHKEFRFLQSSLPFLMLIISRQMNWYRSKNQKICAWMFVLVNLLVTLYLSLVHQRGVVDAALWIGNKGYKLNQEKATEVLFLMPCHSTPLHSHIHFNVSTRFLRCEPNLLGLGNYTDEADLFYSAPSLWISSNLSSLPDILVFFDSLEPAISSLLGNYTTCSSFVHTHLPQGRVGRNVVVACLNRSLQN